MQTISRLELERMLTNGRVKALVDVLTAGQYRKFHLPSAINVPLDDDFDRAIQSAVPNKSATVVVYCMDQACDASPKAARALERLGYREVYDYAAGKMDWRGAGLPIEP